MSILLCWAGIALAGALPHGGLLLPDAITPDSAPQEFAVTMSEAWWLVPGMAPVGAGVMDARYARSGERWAFAVRAGGLAGYAGVVPGMPPVYASTLEGGFAHLSLTALTVATPRFRLAVYGQGVATIGLVGFGGGLALAATLGQRTWLDASVPVPTFMWSLQTAGHFEMQYQMEDVGGAFLFPLAAPELGVGWIVGRHETVRVGFASAFPLVTWRHDYVRSYLEISGSTFVLAGFAQVRVGREF